MNYKTKTEHNVTLAMETLSKSIQNKELINKNLLTKVPEPQMTLYGYSGGFVSEYFDTKEELDKWIKINNKFFGTKYTIEYLGDAVSRSDVIRVTYESGQTYLFTAIDEEGYAIYNVERSINCGEYVWEFNYGSIKEMYAAFRDRGISFKNDIYGKIDKRNQKILGLFKEK